LNTTSEPIRLRLTDPDTPVGELQLTASCSDPTLVPNAGLVFSGSGAERVLTIQPGRDRHGAALVTVTVSDGVLTASQTFGLSVVSGARIAKISRTSDGLVVLELEGLDAGGYVVETSKDFQVWTAVAPSGAPQPAAFLDPQPPVGLCRFYRVRQDLTAQ
jgi:hypothetical protein